MILALLVLTWAFFWLVAGSYLLACLAVAAAGTLLCLLGGFLWGLLTPVRVGDRNEQH